MKTNISTNRTSTKRDFRWAAWAVLLGLLVVMSSVVSAQDDDGLVNGDAPPPVAANRFQVDVNQFDQWVFNGSRNAREGRKRIDSQLAMRMNEVDRVCDLDKVQKQKLWLAAAGDIKRFYDDMENVRAKFMNERNNPNAFGNLWQEVQPLQQKVNSGLFDCDSLFHKTIRGTLDDKQRAKFDRAELARRQFRFEAQVGAVVSSLEQRMPLTDEQRRPFIKLIQEAGPPPLRFGQYDQFVVWYYASRIPSASLNSLFDDVQLKVLDQQLMRGKSMGQILKREGYIE